MDLKEKLLSSFIAFENQYSTDNSYVNELRGEAITNFEKTELDFHLKKMKIGNIHL